MLTGLQDFIFLGALRKRLKRANNKAERRRTLGQELTTEMFAAAQTQDLDALAQAIKLGADRNAKDAAGANILLATYRSCGSRALERVMREVCSATYTGCTD